MILNYIVKDTDENIQLKYILKRKLHISTNLLKRLKNNKCIFVNDKPEHVDYILHAQDKILVNLDNMDKGADSTVVPSKSQNLDILYEDEYILAINKPFGIDTHPSMGNFDSTLANMVMRYYIDKNYNIPKIHIITRLDKNTSGVCLIAKNEYIQELFLRKKEDIKLIKEYVLACSGIVDNDHFIIEKKIARKPGSIILREVNEITGEYAKTEVFVEKRHIEKDYTICKVLLHTGRTHQIRVHFTSILHPLLGDELYSQEVLPSYDIQKYISRQSLHAKEISFYHPITNKYIKITAHIPEDMLFIY